MARPKAKREVILKSAASMFAIKGFHDTSINEIAIHANIGKGTIYEYFNSKNTLFLEVIRYTTSQYLIRVKEELNKQTGFSNQMEAYLKINSKLVEENFKATGTFLATRDSLSAATENGQEIMGIFTALRNDTIDIIISILEVGVSEGVVNYPSLEFAADMFLEMSSRVGMNIFFNQLDEASIVTEHQKLIQLFLTGVGSRL